MFENRRTGPEICFAIIEALRPATAFVHSETRREAQEALVDSIRTYFRACGWGLLSFDFDNANDPYDLYDVSTVEISKLPELDISQGMKDGEDGLNTPWIGFLKGVICGLLEVIAPDVDNKRILGQTFNKYNRTLTFFVARQNHANMGETSSVEEEIEKALATAKQKKGDIDRETGLATPVKLTRYSRNRSIRTLGASATLRILRLLPIPLLLP